MIIPDEELEEIAKEYLDYFNIISGKKGNEERRNLVKGRHPLSDAFDRVINIIEIEPLELSLKLLHHLMQEAKTEEQLAYIAAGPIEDLLSQSDQAFDEILERARKDHKWKESLYFVWGWNRLGHDQLKRLRDFLARVPPKGKTSSTNNQKTKKQKLR